MELLINSTIAIGTFLLFAVTFSLVLVTRNYVKETSLIRLLNQRPSFTLESQGDIIGIYLLNMGETATNVRIDCSSSSFTKAYYIMSMGSDSRVFLDDVPIDLIVNKREELKFLISCEDRNNEKYFPPPLIYNFQQIIQEDRTIIYQSNKENDSN